MSNNTEEQLISEYKTIWPEMVKVNIPVEKTGFITSYLVYPIEY